jgi:16S rRNA (guanine527-N7)-methyltransferase
VIGEEFSEFVDLFQKWNQRINLSAAATREEIEEHVQDSLHVVPILRGRARVLDVGSGGGFPVVIAAISLPDNQFVALEPIHKKLSFLRTAARELRLLNLEAVAARLEDHPSRDFDAAMSRATFDLAEWLRRGREHVRPGGVVVGFEAQRRDDLGVVERFPYEISGKSRAIVTQLVPQGSAGQLME